MNLQYSGEPGSSLELEETAPTLEKLRHPKRIPVKCRQRNRFIPAFLIGVAVLSLVSLLYLGIDWGKMASRIPDIGVVFWDLAHLDFSNMDLIFSSLVETVSIAVLSLLYSLVLGVVFGMLAARNVFRVPVLSVATQALFTFLRAVPTPVWVLLMLVCLGMGPEAGVAGLCVHTTAFFTKSFAQSFESIPEETIEALEALFRVTTTAPLGWPSCWYSLSLMPLRDCSCPSRKSFTNRQSPSSVLVFRNLKVPRICGGFICSADWGHRSGEIPCFQRSRLFSSKRKS